MGVDMNAQTLQTFELRVNAMLQEISDQRTAMGERAANLAADNAELREQVVTLKKRIEEFEPKPAPETP